MKKIFAIVLVLLMMTSPVMACPAWECQLDICDYSCGGYHGCGSTGSYNYSCGSESSYNYYDEYSEERQPIYCQYCGNEMWCCTCGTYQESYGYDCGYQESYSCSGGSQMSHWANIRDNCGNIIGQVGAGSSVEVCGTDPYNPDRVLIYDYNTGTYGSVLSECVYGGYSWNGTGDNGVYQTYQGGGCNDDYGVYSACVGDSGCGYGYSETGCDYYGGYDDCSADYGNGDNYNSGAVSYVGCNAYSQSYYVTYCETIVQRCVTYRFGGMSELRCMI